MAFCQSQAKNHQETIMAIKRKYSNNTKITTKQELSKITHADRKIQSKENYYQSPSRHINSTPQSNVKTNYFMSQNSDYDTKRTNQELSHLSSRDYMTVKVSYASTLRKDSLTTNIKRNIQNNNPKQVQLKQRLSFRKNCSKQNKEILPRFGGQVQNKLNQWNKQRSKKSKQLKQTQSHRANQAFEIKQKNRKVINDIQQMVTRIKSSLRQRNC